VFDVLEKEKPAGEHEEQHRDDDHEALNPLVSAVFVSKIAFCQDA
jgi:hypothetical protein